MIFRKNDLDRMAHKVVAKEILKKINSIDDDKEKEEALKHSIILAMKNKYHHLSVELINLKDKEHHLTISRMLHLIPSKIDYFKINFEYKEFKKIYGQLLSIKKEIENVQSIKHV